MKIESELKKVFQQIKRTKGQIQGMIKDGSLLEEAKKYAETQGKEVKKLIRGDLTKVRGFLEKEKKELKQFQTKLDKLQKNLPSEIRKLRAYMDGQLIEAERFVRKMKRFAQTGKTSSGGGSKRTPSSAGRKRTKTVKTTGSSSAAE